MDPATPLDISAAILFPGVLYGLAVLGLTWFGSGALTRALVGLGNRFTDKRPLLNQVMTVARFTVWSIGFAIAAALSLNLSKEVIIAVTGTAAVAVGFALKDLAASVIAGVTIIVDRPFQVGDRVTFGGIYGEISAIGLRSVRLVTLDDNVVTIPNNKFLTDVVASGNWGALDMLVQTDFFIGADQDPALAKRLVSEAITSSRYAFLKKPWTVLVNQVIHDGYFAVRVRAKVYVLDVQYETELSTDITERVLQAFAEHGVRAPTRVFQHRDHAA